MSQKKINLIHTVYGICTAALVVAVGVLFAFSCFSLYKSDAQPFSRESVAASFDNIAIPVYICIAFVIGGLVLKLALPLDEKKTAPRRMVKGILENAERTFDEGKCPAELLCAVKRERKLRVMLNVATALFILGCALPCLFYFLNTANFPGSEPMKEVGMSMLILIPAAVASGAFGVARSVLQDASYERQLLVIKEAAKLNGKKTAEEENKNTARNKKAVYIVVRAVIAFAAVALIILGVFNGGMRDVLGKAINICRECIGLG